MRRLILPVFVLFLVACGSKQRTETSTPPDYLSIVTTSISGGAALAEIFSQQAIEAGNWQACVASEVISEASQSAASALANYGNEIPAVDVDVSECLALNSGFEPGNEDDSLTEVISTLTTSVLETAQLLVERELTDTDQCTTRAYVVGALQYVEGSARPIVEEVVSPDGILSIPSVEFDFSACSPSE